MKRSGTVSFIAFFALVGTNIVVWQSIAAGEVRTGFYALDVGQGDATLVVLRSGAKVLTDAGPPSGHVTRALETILPAGDRYIDLAIVTHPQLDHFGGFRELLQHFEIGAFIMNGRTVDQGGAKGEWDALVRDIASESIPVIVLGARDRIRIGAENIDVVSPDADFVQSGELNDTGLVALVRGNGWRTLLTADIGENVERHLVLQGIDIRADILKVGHHGSKFSSSEPFLRAVSPKAAVIEVGAGNRYGHPAPETLERLSARVGGNIFRTDRHGTVSIYFGNGAARLLTEKLGRE